MSVGPGAAPEHEGGDARLLGGELEALRGRPGIFGEFADDRGNARVAQAFLHCQQDIGIAARLDMDDTVGMKTSKVERGGEEVAPPQAPEDRPAEPRQDAGKEDGGRGVIGELSAAGDLVQGACCNPAARQMGVDPLDPEREERVIRTRALDLRNARAQLIEDGGGTHDRIKTQVRLILFLICSSWRRAVKWRVKPWVAALVRFGAENRAVEASKFISRGLQPTTAAATSPLRNELSGDLSPVRVEALIL